MEIKELLTAIPAKRLYSMNFKLDFILENFEVSRANFSQNATRLIKIGSESPTGYKCSCCGSTDIRAKLNPDTNRFSLIIRNNGKYNKLTRDHNILRSLGGTDDQENMSLMCESCNNMRGSSFAEYREFKDHYDMCMEQYGKYKSVLPNYCHIDVIDNAHSYFQQNLDRSKPIKMHPELAIARFKRLFNGDIPNKGIRLQNFFKPEHFTNYTDHDWNIILRGIMQVVVNMKGFDYQIPHTHYTSTARVHEPQAFKRICSQYSNMMKKDLQYYLRECVGAPQPGDAAFIKKPDYDVQKDTLGETVPVLEMSFKEKIQNFLSKALALWLK